MFERELQPSFRTQLEGLKTSPSFVILEALLHPGQDLSVLGHVWKVTTPKTKFSPLSPSVMHIFLSTFEVLESK